MHKSTLDFTIHPPLPGRVARTGNFGCCNGNLFLAISLSPLPRHKDTLSDLTSIGLRLNFDLVILKMSSKLLFTGTKLGFNCGSLATLPIESLEPP